MKFTVPFTLYLTVLLGVTIQPAPEGEVLTEKVHVQNVLPPLHAADHLVGNPKDRADQELPVPVGSFDEHVRGPVLAFPHGEAVGLTTGPGGELYAITNDAVYQRMTDDAWKLLDKQEGVSLDSGSGIVARWARDGLLSNPGISNAPQRISARVRTGDGKTWIGTERGLALVERTTEGTTIRYVFSDSPFLTSVTALAVDSQQCLWVGTPFGLLSMKHDGQVTSIRGRDGLPCEDVTAVAVDNRDRLWIGTSRGLIQYRPYEPDRQWFYRAGKRYLIDDRVSGVAVAQDGLTVYVSTPSGIGVLNVATTTLLERARRIEMLVNERHRRLGMVAECDLDDAENPTSHTIGDNDNDGLWTAYHVASMSLCYGATKDAEAKRSATESMHALYMLQNASGIPGLVARSVVPPEIGVTKDTDKPEPRRQWRKTPDGTMYWKSDTSSDEIDGHYLAFYTFFEHIARNDRDERALIEKQVRALTDYLIENNYQLIDWDGERTRWGFWNPEALNENPDDYIENGLNSLQILSFLRVAHHVTGDQKYLDHYRKLIVEHGYLNNVLLSKKVWPDENNHSDDQLGFVAWYPILQIEKDPAVSRALLGGVRRHYKVVADEKPSFYTFVYATVDKRNADIGGAVENLMQIPTDRRDWRMENSHRADVHFNSHPNRFGRPQLTHVLPADERAFQKWNGDPYEPDGGGDGRHEDDGAAYLLPYWMGRFHGFIAEAE